MEDTRESHTKRKRLRGEDRIRKAKLPVPQFSQAKDMFVVLNPLRRHRCVTFDQVLVHICELAWITDYLFLMHEQKGVWHLMCCLWHESPQISPPSRSPLQTVAFQRVKTGQPALLDLPILVLREREGLHRKSRSLTVCKFESKGC